MQGRNYVSEYAEHARLARERLRVRLLLGLGMLALLLVLGSLWMALARGPGGPAGFFSGLWPWAAGQGPAATGCFALSPEPPELTALIRARIGAELGGADKPRDELNLKLEERLDFGHGVVVRPNGSWYHYYLFRCACGHWQNHVPDLHSSAVLKDADVASAYYRSSNCELCEKEWQSREGDSSNVRR